MALDCCGSKWRYGGSFGRVVAQNGDMYSGSFRRVVAPNGDMVAHLEELWLQMEIVWLIWKRSGSKWRYGGSFGRGVAQNGDMVAHSKEGAATPEDSGGSFGKLGPIKEICWLIERCDGLIVGHRQLEI